MRVALLTSGGQYAQRVLIGLGLRGLSPEGVVIVSPLPSGGRRRAVRSLARRRPSQLAAGVLRRGLAAVDPDRIEWEGLAGSVHRAGRINGPGMLSALRSLSPDLLILGGVGIVGPEALAIPAHGTLNAHPALLPWARGVGVVERSLERGIAVGASAHWVTEGIDTGDLVRRELIPVAAHDTLATLRRKTDARCVELLVELGAAAAAGELPASASQAARGDLCTWPSGAEVRTLEQRVAGGLALDLYRRWRELYGGDVLPVEDTRDPLDALGRA